MLNLYNYLILRMKHRLKILIKWAVMKGICANQKDLGRKIGYNSEHYFSQLVNNDNKIAAELLPKLKKLIENLNEEWLLTGEGDMITNNSATNVKIENSAISQVDTATNCTFNNNAYQRPACLNYQDEDNVLGCPEGVLIPVDIRTIPNNVRLRDYCLNGTDHDTAKESLADKKVFKYKIRTNLLYPRLFKGDWIIFYLVKDKSMLQNGRCYVVDCPVHGKMIKRLYIHENGYTLELPDPKKNYPLLQIPKDHIDDVDFYEFVSRISTDMDSIFSEESYNFQSLAIKLAENEHRLLKMIEKLSDGQDE